MTTEPQKPRPEHTLTLNEYMTFQLDYLKHIATLSTGAIVIIATFLEKLFAKPEWKILIIISLVSFLVSVIGTVLFHTHMIFGSAASARSSETWEPSTIAVFFGFISITMMWLGLLAGLISLIIFTAKNLY